MGWMILGAIMGSIVSQSTLVIGIVSILHPVIITNLSPFLIARTFLFIAIFFLLLFLLEQITILLKKNPYFYYLFIYSL